LVDFSYCWAESWIENADQDEESAKCWYCGLASSALIFYLASLTGTIIMYIYFADVGDCYYNVIFVSVNLVVAVVYSLLTIMGRIQEANPKVGLLQPAVVAAYSTYLVASAIMSEPNEQCNPTYGGTDFQSMSTLDIIFLILGSIITIFAVCFSTISTATSSNQLTQANTGETLLTKADEESPQPAGDGGPVDYNYTFFHFAFALASMYMCQLLVNWSTLVAQDNSSRYEITDFGWTSVFIKMGSSWLVALMFIWSLVAPVLLPDREWYS